MCIRDRSYYFKPVPVFLQERKELFQPALFVHRFISARPAAKLFSIISQHKQALFMRILVLPEEIDRFLGGLERY